MPPPPVTRPRWVALGMAPPPVEFPLRLGMVPQGLIALHWQRALGWLGMPPWWNAVLPDVERSGAVPTLQYSDHIQSVPVPPRQWVKPRSLRRLNSRLINGGIAAGAFQGHTGDTAIGIDLHGHLRLPLDTRFQGTFGIGRSLTILAGYRARCLTIPSLRWLGLGSVSTPHLGIGIATVAAWGWVAAWGCIAPWGWVAS
jgi:hypothetical protein